MLNEIFLLCMLFGCLAGILSGLFGIGGGLVLVPFFHWLFTLQGFDQPLIMIMAVATSLATIICTSIASVLTHNKLGAIRWKTVFYLTPGIIVGVILGAMTADFFSSGTLKIIFSVFMLYVALQMALHRPNSTRHWHSSPFLMSIAGGLIGLFSAILGIGGGTMTVPLLSKCQFPMKNAVAVSSACGFPIAVAGTISYTILGWDNSGLPVGCVGYIYLPAFLGIICSSILFAPLGAKLANKLATQQLKRYFSILLMLVAVKLMLAN